MHTVATLTAAAIAVATAATPWAALAKTTASRGGAACAWDHPGHDAFTGDLSQAVDHYRDISPTVREQLKARMAAHDYDDIVVITRDSIEGRESYGSQITGMHFGAGRMCGAVTRDAWSEQHRETGLVYCAGSQCLLVPAVCRNLSRIVPRTGPGPRPAAPPDELVFEPPGAISPPQVVPPPASDVPPALTPPLVGGPPLLVPPVAVPPAFGAPPEAPPPLLVEGPPEVPPRWTPAPPQVFWPPWWPPEYSPPGVGLPPPWVPITPVPEPRAWMLLILGIAALAFWFTRRR
jgi:hypothetical protein